MICAGYLLSALLVGAFASFAAMRLKIERQAAAHAAELDRLRRQSLPATPHHPV